MRNKRKTRRRWQALTGRKTSKPFQKLLTGRTLQSMPRTGKQPTSPRVITSRLVWRALYAISTQIPAGGSHESLCAIGCRAKVAELLPTRIPLSESSHRERDNDYRAVVARLNGSWRVIECKDRIQWILQCADGKRHGQTRWTGRSYCRTRQVLIRDSRTHAGEIDAIALAILEALPDWIGGRP